MFGVAFGGHTPVFVENSIALKIDVDLLFTRFKVDKLFEKKCGFDLQMFRNAVAKVGPFVCADTWDELVIPQVDVATGSFSGQMELCKQNLAKEEIDQGTAAKDLGLGLAMAFGCLWGTILMSGAVVCTFRLVRLACWREPLELEGGNENSSCNRTVVTTTSADVPRHCQANAISSTINIVDSNGEGKTILDTAVAQDKLAVSEVVDEEGQV
eukprot:SRR837773.9409.p1 GENE.SRR837773.9409~~SRR837773.9409.p1  ORF type:complete len:223 (-),score=27.45 SRR837773.9409:59-694(-)